MPFSNTESTILNDVEKADGVMIKYIEHCINFHVMLLSNFNKSSIIQINLLVVV